MGLNPHILRAQDLGPGTMFKRLYDTQNPIPLGSATDRGGTSLKHRLFSSDDEIDTPTRLLERRADSYNKGLISQRVLDEGEDDSCPRSPIRRTHSAGPLSFNRSQPHASCDNTGLITPAMNLRHRQSLPTPVTEHQLAAEVKRKSSQSGPSPLPPTTINIFVECST